MFAPSILQHNPDASPRRIRFAPLPDPRRSVLITDDGEELPIPNIPSSSHFPAIPTPSPTNANRSDYFAGFDAASSCSSSSDSRLNSDSQELSSSSSASSISATPTPPLHTPTDTVSSESPLLPYPPTNKKSFSFFRSLKRNSGTSSPSSSSTLTPVPSLDRTPNASTTFSRRNISAEEILTLGTINLFRTTSKDTCDADPHPSAWSLTRWSSASSAREPYVGSPLYRVSSAQSTRSTQSYQSTSTLKAKIRMPKRASNLQPPSRKGTRMLNGRVYGGKQNANPFANARDEEPSFVEWGYGGMGSVKGATSAGAHGRWERLQNSQQEEDDASGMAWIKKRREQRERERKEREEHENPSEATPTVTQPEANSTSPTSSASSSSLAGPSVMPSPSPSQSTTPTDDEHVMTAINIPAPHHYLRHSHSRSASKDGSVACVPREIKAVESESEGSRSSTSDSDSDGEHEDDSSSSGDDDEEEEEEERKTALGAGVEKISRHH
ncbi:hypothetical protein AGABI1DRAFT_111600 [Agaricus bisporus var. burnettii JB137-S8]|uniref:Uncharacterized protein n=1 Tax=Agaricus bisporus var. burnettii (strain JB137-S8 / ATCC MYA-4627 / FGSC 10392) TaxID=597362 RepID=K5Y4X3_AGABU|nr:uncharacterized protein AGABI1DRAFT_111600 [Agaricus bisporus var. burnettii JB137-S8]EKM83085.1 hypothetical protein AGABI1DRAFT_111600 [Agaricus bisporus var. burnettii JB137-S8]